MLHLVKLCVGIATIEELVERQLAHYKHGKRLCHITRMTPSRSEELLRGGSLYWVIKHRLCVRQRLTAIEPFRDADGVRRCRLVLAPQLVRVVARRRRPFQGWRYLPHAAAPPDKPGQEALIGVEEGAARRARDGLPPELEQALDDIGVR